MGFFRWFFGVFLVGFFGWVFYCQPCLQAEAAKRRATLESSTEAYQFFSDCNETDSVIKECVTIAKSKDFGQDKLTALSLLQRHRQLGDKVAAIAVDVTRVQENGKKLTDSQISQEALYLTADPAKQEVGSYHSRFGLPGDVSFNRACIFWFEEERLVK